MFQKTRKTTAKERAPILAVVFLVFWNILASLYYVLFNYFANYTSFRGGRKVERKGQQQGPMEANFENSRTSEWLVA